jgi:predicted component of type VI protein secretion system
MKVSLVVASGVHQGKVVPIVGPQFLVGRDPQCQLRPASQAVSKQHCAVIIRDGKVYLKDYSSTNGTLLNDAVVQGEERELNNNDSVKIGPLDFLIRIEPHAVNQDGTPLPGMSSETAAALAAVKAVTRPAATKNATPSPGSKETPPLKNKPTAAEEESEQDRLAAMMLGMDDADVPGGSTIADVRLPAEVAEAPGEKPGENPPEKKKVISREDSSNAASDILRKYMRRPR